MKLTTTKILSILLFVAAEFFGQNTEIEKLLEGELKMTFPSIYFKHNSAEYATMPYSVDSCFKYIATNIKNLNSYSIWKDSLEKERLTYIRMKKLKKDLHKYVPSNKINFQSMGTAQKISRQTIEKSIDDKQIQYLLSLNAVLDVSGALKNKNASGKEKKQRKGIPRLVWCGWKYGFHWSDTGSRNKKKKSTT